MKRFNRNFKVHTFALSGHARYICMVLEGVHLALRFCSPINCTWDGMKIFILFFAGLVCIINET